MINNFNIKTIKNITLIHPQNTKTNTYNHILNQLPHLQLPTLKKLKLINTLNYTPNDIQPSNSTT